MQLGPIPDSINSQSEADCCTDKVKQNKHREHMRQEKPEERQGNSESEEEDKQA